MAATNKFTIKASASFKAALWAAFVNTLWIAFALGIFIWIGQHTNWSIDKNDWKVFIDANKDTYTYLVWSLFGFTIIVLVVMVIAYIWITINSIVFIFTKNSFWTKIWSIITLAFGVLILGLWALNIAGQYVNTSSIQGIMPEPGWEIVKLIASLGTYGLIITTGICKHCVRTSTTLK